MKLIPLTQGQFAKVSDVDYTRAKTLNWCAHRRQNGSFYAVTNIRNPDGSQQTLGMHQFLTDQQFAKVDHKDRDGLNNQRSNLRDGSGSRNSYNAVKPAYRKGVPCSSRFKGVSRSVSDGNWQAHCNYSGKSSRLGGFSTEVAAARAYDTAARKYFGSYARLNFPNGAS